MSLFRHLLVTLTCFVVACSTMIADPHLTSVEVIRLADAAARRHGERYDPRQFNRNKPEYAARFHQWWVRYDPKQRSSGREAFTVGVDDKTREAGLILP
jgi:hypothetical protein